MKDRIDKHLGKMLPTILEYGRETACWFLNFWEEKLSDESDTQFPFAKPLFADEEFSAEERLVVEFHELKHYIEQLGEAIETLFLHCHRAKGYDSHAVLMLNFYLSLKSECHYDLKRIPQEYRRLRREKTGQLSIEVLRDTFSSLGTKSLRSKKLQVFLDLISNCDLNCKFDIKTRHLLSKTRIFFSKTFLANSMIHVIGFT